MRKFYKFALLLVIAAITWSVSTLRGEDETPDTSGKEILVKGSKWVMNGNSQIRSFVENKGQFDDRLTGGQIRYGFEGPGYQVFLMDGKVGFKLYRAESELFTEEEIRERHEQEERKRGEAPPLFSAEEEEREGKQIRYTSETVYAEWLGANPNAQIITSEMDDFTHAYEYAQGEAFEAQEGIRSFGKVTYKNLYPNVDVEYIVHPQSGVKYSVILHPGADLSQVRLRYSRNPQMQSDGTLLTETRTGKILDHAPYSFYADTEAEIASMYILNGNEISFSLGNYDINQKVVIDPWTDLPNDPGSNWNCAWECETDAAGNSYAIFGAWPLQLRKYNAAGAIQWTYNTTYDTSSWLGTFVTDDAGNSFVTRGSTAAIRRVSTAGALVWSVGNNSGHLLGEYWNIAFNCDQTKLVTGGTGGALSPIPYIYDIDPATGAMLGSVQIHVGTGLFSPSEVRAITATEGAKYYWLTNDSIGYLSQSFSACPSSTGPTLIADNNYGLSYKCENWRVNNTGIEALAYYGGFAYVNRGDRIDKREFATGAIVASAAIPGGGYTSGFGGSQVQNSGIIIDNTGRIFVGSRGSVSQFDVNLALVNTYSVTGGYNVYDVDLTSSGQLIACGATGTSGTGSRTGTVESLGILGSAPYVMPCCDANVCAAGPFCETDGPVTLTPAVGGGTWTSSAPGFNAGTGEFDPSVAGLGTYTIYYTLACGTDSLQISVIPCPTLDICVEPNGDLTVSGGNGTYTWESGTMVTSCPFGSGPGCALFTHAVQNLTWTGIGSGTTITPPAGSDTIRVSDGTLEGTSWDIGTLPPCSAVLGLQLESFEGTTIPGSGNLLMWTTAFETDNDFFTLQASEDGKTWKTIGTVAGKGNSALPTHYEFTDTDPHYPMTYYRIGATSKDGQYQHLSYLEIYMSRDNNLVHNVHPNPANTVINFGYNFMSEGDEPLTVSFVNNLGMVVMERKYTGLSRNMNLQTDVSMLPSGMYYMSFKQGSRSVFVKVIIVHEE